MYTRTICTAIFILSVIVFLRGSDIVRGVIATNVPHRLTIAKPTAVSDQSKLGTTINYTAVGDSITAGVGASTPANSYVQRFAQFLADDNSSTVQVDNRAVTGMTSAQLLTALQTDAAMRTSIQNAQVITFNVGSNDYAAARTSYQALTCGGTDGQDCLRAATSQFKTNWNLIVQEILLLRANTGVSVRAIDLYYPSVQADRNLDSFPGDGGLNDFQAMGIYLDEANAHIRATTLSTSTAFGRVHRSFNGPEGSSDPGFVYSLLGGDGFHPNDRGHSVIADRVRSTVPICVQPQTGLAAWYRAEGNANDSTANNNHATLENGTAFLAGKVGQAFSFDGNDDSVLLPTLDLGPAHTIEMWINPSLNQSSQVVELAVNDPGSSGFGALRLVSDMSGNYSLQYRQANSDRILTGPIIVPGVWAHIALVRSIDARMQLYVDRELAGESVPFAGGDYDNPMRLGGQALVPGSFFSGLIDDVSLLDRALSPAEIGAIVDADTAGRCIITDLQIAPTSATVNVGGSQIFTVTGGVSPYVFSMNSPPFHGTIDPVTGQYTRTSPGVDTVRVTDAALFTSDATVLAGTDAPCNGSQKVWDGGGSNNNWSNAINWCGNTVPTASDNVVFDATSVKDVTVNVAVAVNSINVAAGYTGTITANSGIDMTVTGSFALNGGIFNAPAGTLTLNQEFTRNGGAFNHANGTVVFGGNSNVGLTFAGEVVFNNLTINKGNGANVNLTQPNGTVRIIGTLTLTEGLLSRNSDSVFRAENAVSISPDFGEPTFSPPGGNGILKLQGGTGARIVTIPAGASLPTLVVDDQNLTINGSGTGTFRTSQFEIHRGSVNMGSVDVIAGFGGRCVNQTGGSFSIGSGDFLCQAGFALNQSDGVSSFTAGTGNFTLNSPGNSFEMSAGTFTAPTGATVINTGEFLSNFVMSGGTFNANGSFDCQCAAFALSGGTFNATSGTSTFRRNFNRTGGTFNANGGTVVLASQPGGSVVGDTTFNNLTINYTDNNHQFGTVVLTVNGLLNLQSGTIDQGGSFILNGNLQIASTFGGATSHITFSGNGTQTYSNSGGVNPTGTWTINKPTGTVNLNSDLDASNGVATFDLVSGNIFTGTNTLSTGARSVSGGTAGFILGNLRRSFQGGGTDRTLTYHVGTASGFAPVTVRVPNTPGPTSTFTPLAVRSVGTGHPLFDPTTSLSLFWTITEGVGLTNTDVTFVYPQAAVNGNEASYRVDRIENGNIQIFNNTIFITTNTVTLTGVNNFVADWTISELPPPLVLSGPNPATVNPGDTLHYTVSGGRPPYDFDVAINNSGATLSEGPTSVFYTAGSTAGVTDTLRVTDDLGTTQDAMITVVNQFVVINTNDSGAGSLRDAIINANGAPGTQTITFNIPGPPPYSIAAVSPRRFNITETIVIDGTSQPGFAGSPIIEVKNAQFNLFANGSTIKGLVINGATQGTDTRGIYIGGNTSGNIVQGNYIGTDVTGMIAMPNGVGIQIQSAQANVIGGSTPVERNVISGNTSHGIDIFSLTAAVPAIANIIKSNYIGVGADGVTPIGNGDSGIHLDGAQDNQIGGIAANEGNVIANNVIAGISTSNFSPAQAFGNSIRGNSLFLNGALGIDIRPNGVSANDPCDDDNGENRRQNFPDLTSVAIVGASTNVQGTLVGEADKTFTLDFYSNTGSDDSGFGEGETYLGSGQVVTGANCSGIFDLTLPVALPIGRVVTATATDPDGNTSEFSQFRGLQPADLSGTILDASSSPMPGVAVKLNDLNRGGRTVRTAATDKAGRFKFANVALGRDYQVVPARNNFVFVPANRTYNDVVSSHDDGFTGIVNSFTIGGRVMMGGFSLSGATITLSGATNAITTTNSTGDYAFSNLPSGAYTVTPGKQDVAFTPPLIVFSIPITSNQTANFNGVSAALAALPGRIVFADTDGNIKMMNPDGTGLVNVIPRTQTFSYESPRFSRDGKKVIFNARNTTGNTSTPGEVRTSSIDGGLRSPDLHPSSPCITPVFSPDGTKISCVKSGANSQILLFNSDGSGSPQSLVLSTNLLTDPDWNPDGSSLIFSRFLQPPNARISKVIVTTHASSDIFGIQNARLTEARFSPNGTRILLDKREANVDLIGTINSDGGNLNIVAASDAENFLSNPTWSPDGGRVAFLSHSGSTDLFKIITTLPNGTDPLQITSNISSRLGLDWGPDNEVATPSGQNTQVLSGRVNINFPTTSSSGITTITPIDPAAAGITPGGFVVDGVAFEISTTATFTPPAEVCIRLTLIEPTVAQFNAYTFMHNEGGVMVDRTSLRDFPNRTICGSLPSFSPIALMKQVDPALPMISGLVLDANGDPMSDVQVSISDDETPVKTDFNGHFEFVNLKPGANYFVQAFKVGHLFAPPYQTFFGLSGDETVVFTATAEEFDISGRVQTGNGIPLAGVTVTLGGHTDAEVLTDGDGVFRFTGLPANASFTLSPIPDGNSYSPAAISVDAIQRDLAGLVFTQFAPTAAHVSVSGRVTTTDGLGIRKAQLILTSRSGERLTALTGPFGFFRFDNIEAGETYLLEVVHKRYQFGGSPRVLSVEDELTDIDFTGSPP